MLTYPPRCHQAGTSLRLPALSWKCLSAQSRCRRFLRHVAPRSKELFACSSSCLHCQFAYVAVEHHSEQQYYSNDRLVPLSIDARKDDADLDDAKGQCPEHGTDS